MIKAGIRNFLAHKGRMALSTLAVLLGVAFVSGTLVFSDTINVAFTDIAGSTAADVTVKPKQAFTPRSRTAACPARPRPCPRARWPRSPPSRASRPRTVR
ncbi:hypothetical protein ACIRRH_43750 [Kitasatospora sp. NPDC101235]|uniref:hypothetical protein n=1 Tax=Kitasatospora sp. NPDC101235 TaxID=3364101 RepID=UPI0037FD9C62